MGYALILQYPAKKFTMNTKKQLLLPSPKLLPFEWASIEKYLEGHTEVRKGREVYFEEGFAVIEKRAADEYQANWHDYDTPEPDTVNIMDLDVDPSLVRYYLQSSENPKEFYQFDPKYPSYTIKEFISDGIIELQFLFTQAALKL